MARRAGDVGSGNAEKVCLPSASRLRPAALACARTGPILAPRCGGRDAPAPFYACRVGWPPCLIYVSADSRLPLLWADFALRAYLLLLSSTGCDGGDSVPSTESKPAEPASRGFSARAFALPLSRVGRYELPCPARHGLCVCERPAACAAHTHCMSSSAHA